MPVQLAIVDCELVVAGVTAMLADHRASVRIVRAEPTYGSPLVADVVLYDPAGPEGEGGLVRLVDDACASVVAFSWRTDPEVRDRALLLGAAGYLFKGLAADGLAAAIVGASRRPVSRRVVEGAVPVRVGHTVSRERLTPREAAVLGLIVQGMTNAEIATYCYLTINSVKIYVRQTYRKIGVTSRSQAVRWAIHRGLDPQEPARPGEEMLATATGRPSHSL